jgi:hypothetical protein
VSETIRVGSHEFEVVPPGQRLNEFHPQIWLTTFTDLKGLLPRFIERVLVEEDVARRTHPTLSRSLGGQKIFGMSGWDMAEMTLLDARAKSLYRKKSGHAEAHIDLSWINIYRRHDYVIPHCHPRTAASVVLCLDAGDEDPTDQLSGRFTFVDPRLDRCCMEQPGYMTTPLHMNLKAGTMMIFPAQLLHMVTPYEGTRPRITVAWNINSFPIGGSRSDVPPHVSLTKPV